MQKANKSSMGMTVKICGLLLARYMIFRMLDSQKSSARLRALQG